MNGGDIVSRATGPYGAALGIYSRTNGPLNNPISIVNSGHITALSRNRDATDIFAETRGDDSPLSIVNSGNIRSNGGGLYGFLNGGIFADTFGSNSRGLVDGPEGPLDIANTGNINEAGRAALGINAETVGQNSPISIFNSGDVTVYGNGANSEAAGILARNFF